VARADALQCSILHRLDSIFGVQVIFSIWELVPMVANREHFQRLADECIALSAKSDNPHSASELRRISYRFLQLADPTLPEWEEGDIPYQIFGTA
jgi:hypothetical protein